MFNSLLTSAARNMPGKQENRKAIFCYNGYSEKCILKKLNICIIKYSGMLMNLQIAVSLLTFYILIYGLQWLGPNDISSLRIFNTKSFVSLHSISIFSTSLINTVVIPFFKLHVLNTQFCKFVRSKRAANVF